MASVLKVDNIGKTSGKTQDTMSGLAKLWANVDMYTSAVINDSFNASSIVDVAEGAHSITATNNFSNAFYSLVGISGQTGDGSSDYRTNMTVDDLNTTKTTSVFGLRVFAAGINSLEDTNENNSIVMGDLA
jgi:hypothetical protein|tara:strand:+ start:513 stop:905 length:393 start_codon:yes stop_codon:yes gene_type:complete